jgi:hypothetical protein
MKSSSTAIGCSCTSPTKPSKSTPRGHDWTGRFKKVADDGWHISAGSAIIDGEIVVPAADGTTGFSVLQNELKGKSDKLVMVALDLLYLNGYDLRKLPLVERKVHLKKLIAGTAIHVAQRRFDRGMRYQHSFWYINAKEVFEEAIKAEPTCAMVYWGIALTLMDNPHNAIPRPNLAPGLAVHRRADGCYLESQGDRRQDRARYDKVPHA